MAAGCCKCNSCSKSVSLRLDLWVLQFLRMLQGKTCVHLQQYDVCDCCIVNVKVCSGLILVATPPEVCTLKAEAFSCLCFQHVWKAYAQLSFEWCVTDPWFDECSGLGRHARLIEQNGASQLAMAPSC